MSNVFNFGSSSAFNFSLPSTSSDCRRSGERKPLPIEVEIELAGRTLQAIVRDVTIDDKKGRVIGISLMHFEPLSVDRKYVCKPTVKLKQLPSPFTFCVRWCRYFEDEAFISGGVVE
ncbi:hypothetical protein KOR42_14910 [Thalassoglobus neptunius]|uniref:PilZ domain protein n=1 Tax=Thalassoglobus neptunius TaxID=1938619 RepID=A0A5C5X5B6_9PLAN|nr:hypothetical protein [Thalassoglobus neptunius]TWT58120.1 hypothetical protein KOR42_14910 [Thalassoglobus neptunius]